jgi:hypothetical protein
VGNGAGQGGFGAVWGSKRLKAISVIGTGGVKVANPKAMMDARLWYRKFQYNVDNPRMENQVLRIRRLEPFQRLAEIKRARKPWTEEGSRYPEIKGQAGLKE